MKLEVMRKEISSHPDENTQLQSFLNDHGHVCIMLSKFHCELNPVERCWAQAKRYTRAHTNYTQISTRLYQKVRTQLAPRIYAIISDKPENICLGT